MPLKTLSCTFRARPGDLKRCDRIIPRLKRGPLARAGRISRTTVIKIALSYGLDRLERELDELDEDEGNHTRDNGGPPPASLEDWRKREEIGQRAAADRLGMSRRTYGRIERGEQSPTLEQRERLLEVTRVPFPVELDPPL